MSSLIWIASILICLLRSETCELIRDDIEAFLSLKGDVGDKMGLSWIEMFERNSLKSRSSHVTCFAQAQIAMYSSSEELNVTSEWIFDVQ